MRRYNIQLFLSIVVPVVLEINESLLCHRSTDLEDSDKNAFHNFTEVMIVSVQHVTSP